VDFIQICYHGCLGAGWRCRKSKRFRWRRQSKTVVHREPQSKQLSAGIVLSAICSVPTFPLVAAVRADSVSRSDAANRWRMSAAFGTQVAVLLKGFVYDVFKLRRKIGIQSNGG